MSPRDELRKALEQLKPARRAEVTRALVVLLGHGNYGADLLLAAAELDDAQIATALQIVPALQRPVEEYIRPRSYVATAKFAAEFRARLLLHHATYETPLEPEQFEGVFSAASRAARRRVEPSPRGTRFWDVKVRGKQVSLKTEGAKRMREDFLHISKLSEAAWIQDVRTAKARYDHTMDLIDHLVGAVQEMFVLRIRRGPEPDYELVEIPVAHFRRIKLLSRKDFSSDAPRVGIKDDDGNAIMTFCLDRSDAKVTITSLAKSACIVHARWTLRSGS